jgi:hypothetical protein
MKAFLPTPQQERWMTIASRLHLALDHPWIAQRAGGWTAPSLIARCAFFVLGTVAAGLTLAVFDFLHLPGDMFAAGMVMLIAAEWLMLRKHLFHAGMEEALWAAGLLVMVLQAMHPSLDFGFGSAALIALALAVAGIRVLNPLFIALAAAFASGAIDFAGGHRLVGEPNGAVPAGVFCYATAAIALFAARFEFRRSAHERMLDWLIVSMPLCGFLWLVWERALAIRVFIGIACALFGAAALVIGLRRRAHAPLIAFMVCMACAAYQLRDLTALSLTVKLILGGSAALLLTLGLDRYLRTPRRGVTSNQLGASGEALDLLQLAGAAGLSPKPAQHAEAPFKGGGGAFGGGGADGSY